jgi:DNA-directed RNA polymerase specialized sigma24 family protein
MEDRLHSSRSLPAEPGQEQRASLPGTSDQRPPTNPVSADGDITDPEADVRLQADARLRDALAVNDFAGPEYVAFEEDLVKFGSSALMAELTSGLIFTKCAQKGIRLPRWRLGPQDCEELVYDTLARALPLFRRMALVEGRWRPEGGATMKTFFMNFLPYQFANAYREWRKDQDADAGQHEDVPEAMPCPRPGPQEIYLQREAIRDGLAAIESENVRAAVVLTEDGYDQDEIAEIIGTTRRSVEGLLHRHRKKIEAWRKQGGR